MEKIKNGNSPVRILQIVTDMNAGGIETMIMNYYRNIDRDKVQFDFLVHRSHEGFYDSEILAFGGNIYNVPSYHPKEHFAYKKALKKFFRQNGNKYKVVHGHINMYSMYGLREAKGNHIPARISHSHFSRKFKLNLALPFRVYNRFLLKFYTTHRYACSPEAGKYLFGKKEFEIFNNAVNAKAFVYSEANRIKTKNLLDISSNDIVLGHVGRFTDEKNHAFILEVFSELLKLKSNAKLLLVGSGKLHEGIKAKAKEMGIEDKVIFTGVRKDIAELMSAMDIFIFPSKFEGFPVTLIEAQSADLPCFISNTFSKTAIISDRVKVLSLDTPPAVWAEEIAKADITLSRRDNSQMMIDAGLDIKSNAEKLQKVYLEAYGYGE